MKPLSLFFVITGILGIGNMNTAGIDSASHMESIEITSNYYGAEIPTNDSFYFTATEE